jgi:hypothetical protein
MRIGIFLHRRLHFLDRMQVRKVHLGHLQRTLEEMQVRIGEARKNQVACASITLVLLPRNRRDLAVIPKTQNVPIANRQRFRPALPWAQRVDSSVHHDRVGALGLRGGHRGVHPARTARAQHNGAAGQDPRKSHQPFVPFRCMAVIIGAVELALSGSPRQIQNTRAPKPATGAECLIPYWRTR